MINIVIPMAGRGTRFSDAGYKLPKPLIDVKGHPMIEWVIQNITPSQEHRFIFICQKEHIENYHLLSFLRERAGENSVVIPIDHVTEGAACSVLLAKEYINNEHPLMIANSDQFIDYDINAYLASMENYDGLIMTMPADDPKWSFVKREGLFVTDVREKEVISNDATVGIYNFKKGSDFVRYAEKMISQNKRVNNEFYVAPVYNEMIAEKKQIIIHDIGENMHGLGIPSDLDTFINGEVITKYIGENGVWKK